MSKMRGMEKNENNKITNLSDADFISFLYAERDRENSLSQYQGWNNWALIGAFVTVICAGYAILKDCAEISWKDVLYYSGYIISYFLLYYSWYRAIKRERGVDFYKVRMLKEVAPYVQICFVFLYATVSAIIISILDGYNIVFQLWIITIIIYCIAVVLIIVFRNKIIPAYYQELFLPWTWGNLSLVFIIGIVLAAVGQQSLNMAQGGVFSIEFAVAICIAVCLILVFVFALINTNNKSARRFDAIIDDYIYLNISKEETYRKITINRMGYGVMDICLKEFDDINRLVKIQCDEEKDIDEMITLLENEQCSIERLNDINDKAKVFLQNQKRILKLAKQLSVKIKEIIEAVPIYKSIPELDYITKTNVANSEKVNAISCKLQVMLEKVEAQLYGDKNA